MQNINYDNGGSRSVLAALRRLIPLRTVEFAEALRIAELQASWLLQLTGDDPAGLGQEIARLPRIRIQYRQMPTSGLSYWDGQAWIVNLNQTEPATRQRFTLLHEYKHIIDHGYTDRLFTGNRDRSATQQAEQAADYFAGCALMPKRLIKQAWGRGVQRPRDLAAIFDVSARAIEVRLAQLGLAEPTPRCTTGPTYIRPAAGRRRYYRQALSVTLAPKQRLELFR